MKRRWAVVIRAKRYPAVVGRMPHVLDDFDLGQVLVDEGRFFTRWGAERKALRRNIPPALTWRAVVERTP